MSQKHPKERKLLVRVKSSIRRELCLRPRPIYCRWTYGQYFVSRHSKGKTNTMQCERVSKSRATWPAMQTLLDNMRRGALAFGVYKPHQAYLCTHSWLPFGDISLTLRAVLTLATHSAPSSLGKRTGYSSQFAYSIFYFYSLIDTAYFLLLLLYAHQRTS